MSIVGCKRYVLKREQNNENLHKYQQKLELYKGTTETTKFKRYTTSYWQYPKLLVLFS